MKIKFNRPYLAGRELENIERAHRCGHLAGGGSYTNLCQAWLEKQTGAEKAFLTHSCTAALEMSALLADIQPGDEVILPSYTFVSTANAFVLRGAVPVFIDIREDTLNMDETLIESAVSSRTKVIVPVHYAGIACEMDTIMELAIHNRCKVIEDAAQGVMSSYKGKPLGSIGHLGALSFHETKNIISGEGGALLVNDSSLVENAEIAWEKGTNRQRYFKGEVDKYTWMSAGSSYQPSELIAAFLYAQMEEARQITKSRQQLWDRYHSAFSDAELQGKVRRPFVPDECQHNAHMYYLLLPSTRERDSLIGKLREKGIHGVFHYIPLHSSPAGKKYGRKSGTFDVTDNISGCLVRLPMWIGLEDDQDTVIDAVLECL